MENLKTSKNLICFNGKSLINMFSYSKYYLEKHVSILNSLNVFPVPDGDTGTNMFLTIKEVIKSIEKDQNSSASHISKVMSEAALMGAKGNSGVILSQFFKGFESALKLKDNFGYEEFVQSLEYSVDYCYKSVGIPTEGTMLTIINTAAKSARESYENGEQSHKIITYICNKVKNAVLKTPDSLKILKDSGVIDSGALGLYIIFEGIRIYLEGGDLKSSNIDFPNNLNTSPKNISKSEQDNNDEKYGNCIQFFILAKKLNIDEVKNEIKNEGSSVVAVGNDSKIKIHVHSTTPDNLIKIAGKFGQITQVSIENMDAQHDEFILKQSNIPETIVFSISAGKKIGEIFTEFGAINFDIADTSYTEKIIESEILKLRFKNAILLINGFNISSDSKMLSNKSIHILNTNNIADGIAAILNYNPELMIDQNVDNMRSSYNSITSIEIYYVTKNTNYQNIKLNAKEYYSLYNKKLISKNKNVLEMLNELFKFIDLSDKDLITFYKNKEISNELTGKISNHMENIFPKAELEIIEGEFISPMLIISIE